MFNRFFSFGRRPFSSLSEQEILALAISSEEDDARIYLAYADAIRARYPASAKVFEEMAEEENLHRDGLIARHRERFGERIPLIRREHVSGFYERKPDWLIKNLPIDKVRAEAEAMEAQATASTSRRSSTSPTPAPGSFSAISRLPSRAMRALPAGSARSTRPRISARRKRATERRQFILTYVQPGLAGLMDGSVSTLAPIFATAFATHDSTTTLLVGLAAAIGAGISMGFTEAAHDDGKISGRGSPIKRGLACGLMTAAGGLGHALPYLIAQFLDGDRHCGRRRLHRAVGHRLHPEPLDGNALGPRHHPGRASAAPWSSRPAC